MPAEIGQLAGLHTLVLSGCTQLGSLPAEIGQLTGLHTLNLSDCHELESLPAEVGQLTDLQKLAIDSSLRNSLSVELLAALTRNEVVLTH